jgi:hypothetical protein
MTRRLDELFSPDRLRDRWSGEAEVEDSAVAPEAPPPAPDHPTAVAERLAELTERRFERAKNPAMQELVKTLREKVARRFPLEPQPPLPAEELSSLDTEIEALLDQIEDLADALELGGAR